MGVCHASVTLIGAKDSVFDSSSLTQKALNEIIYQMDFMDFDFDSAKEYFDENKSEDVKLVLVGPDDGCLDYLNKLVHDLEIEDNHNFYIITSTEDKDYKNCKGILVHNCGEIVMGVDSCRLMITPLHHFVLHPFTEKAKFDYKGFGKTKK